MLILLFSAAPLCAAPPETLDVGQVLERLARPAPVSTEFV
ncbi:fatty acyl CoA synthetase, partial [Xanthomonas oryzae pv. oryzae]